ncbi:hypothetical protein M9Y10_028172 [Tritrichomonas musculus]|uniref:Rho-GAP domain-containing protein n=1 Tax=Tritrichomonas musculus TaxID=1915356 RepID=A0ABR2KJE0_9EUKA
MENEGFFGMVIEFYLGRIPFIITDLITQLEKSQWHTSKYLFNREYTDNRLEELISELKIKRVNNWAKYDNPAVLSIALLKYINSIFYNEPLITEDVQEILLSIQFTDSPLYLKLLRKILLKLYPGRFQTLSYLTDFLTRSYLLSEDRLFRIFSLPFFGPKSIKLNKPILKEIFRILLRNHDTVFQGSVSKEDAFLTNEQIDFLFKKYANGETVNTIHIEGNLSPEKISQKKLEKMLDEANSMDLINSVKNLHNNNIRFGESELNNCDSNFSNYYPISSNFLYQDSYTQTDCQKNSILSFSDNVIIIGFEPKSKKSKKETSSLSRSVKNKDLENEKDSPLIIKKKRKNLQINQPFVIETHSKTLTLQKNINNYSSYDDFSSSKTNSQTQSSSATSSTTSSYSFYSYTRLDPNLNKFDQTFEPIEAKKYIENNNNKTSKIKKSKRLRNFRDKSDTSDNISYSDNILNNNPNKIPNPPYIPDYLDANQALQKTNYATNHNFNNYFYADNSNERKANKNNENNDNNDKSDSQKGVEVKFDFYKNLVSSNTNEVLPPAPMLDPKFLNSPIFGNDNKMTQKYSQENDIYFEKNEIPSIDINDQITSENKTSESSKNVSFYLKNEPSDVKNSDDTDNTSLIIDVSNEESSNLNKSNIDDDESSQASSCKKEEEEKREIMNDDDIKKSSDEKEKKNFHIFNYFKRKNDKKKKDDKKYKKEKYSDNEKRSKDDKKDKKSKVKK